MPGTCIVLNGLPRHAGQARAIEPLLDVRMIVYLECDAPTVLARIRHDVGGDRTAREDDDPEAIERKLAIFRSRTAPLLDYYLGLGTSVWTYRVTVQTTAAQVWEAIQRSAPPRLAGI